MRVLTAGERIKLLRIERGYNRKQLAERAGISEKFLYEIEMKKKGFSAKTLSKLSEALEVSLDYIMIEDDA
ncbi:MAG: helix-turn-helix domain-containing protein [Ruminococcus flavefaciens]|nr:helix-turn-helix domain-containing protein [Ruminococcus flavefaciens]